MIDFETLAAWLGRVESRNHRLRWGGHLVLRGLVCALLLLLTAPHMGCTTMGTVRDQNRQNLLRLRQGLPRDETLSIMGVGAVTTHPVKYPYSVVFPPYLIMYPLYMRSITNPYRTESGLTIDGRPMEIVYYYTDIKSGGIADDSITDDELTPLVFEQDVLVGWGWQFLAVNAERYQVELRVR